MRFLAHAMNFALRMLACLKHQRVTGFCVPQRASRIEFDRVACLAAPVGQSGDWGAECFAPNRKGFVVEPRHAIPPPIDARVSRAHRPREPRCPSLAFRSGIARLDATHPVAACRRRYDPDAASSAMARRLASNTAPRKGGAAGRRTNRRPTWRRCGTASHRPCRPRRRTSSHKPSRLKRPRGWRQPSSGKGRSFVPMHRDTLGPIMKSAFRRSSGRRS